MGSSLPLSVAGKANRLPAAATWYPDIGKGAATGREEMNVGYPLIVLLVSGSFCTAVALQFRQRRRPYQLAWALALAAGALGSLAYIVFLQASKPELAFRVYYIGGALLTAPLLGLGSLYLVARSPAAKVRVRWVVRVVVGLSLIGVVLLLASPVHTAALQQLDGGPGTDVLKDGPWKPILILLNIQGAVCVFGVAVYSAWQLYRRSGTRTLLAANALIALGTFIISQAGAEARTGFGAGAFWLTMTVGWVVLFGGFLCTFGPAPAPRAAEITRQQRSAHR
jgi:hypothetical protein